MQNTTVFCRTTSRIAQSAFLALALTAPLAAQAAATIWNGPLTNFTKVNFANPGLAANQDHLTSGVWLTRGASQGLYNASGESHFTHFSSPQGTEWADGTTANYSSLTYHDWNTWAKGVHAGPGTTVGVPAVLHLIADNIYLNIQFTSWTSGGAGGGFSYLRATPSIVPEPGAGMLLVAGLGVAGALRFSRHAVRKVPRR